MHKFIDGFDEHIPTKEDILREEWRQDIENHLKTYYFEIEDEEKESELRNIMNFLPIRRSEYDNVYALIKGNDGYGDEMLDTILDACYITPALEVEYPRE